MFDITFNDTAKMTKLRKENKVYPGGEYDFTLEKRFLIYHCPLRRRLVYIAVDLKTGFGSEVLSVKNEERFSVHNFQRLLPPILYAVKYTGDKRYLLSRSQDGLMIIEYIFKVVLPEYGYTVRPEQIALSKSMYKGLKRKSAAICEAEVGTGKTLAFLVAALVARMTQRTESFEIKRPITVATSNIELQRSLIEKDIPQLSEMLKSFQIVKKGICSVLRKGREHYFCKRRFEDFMASLKGNPVKHQELIAQMRELKRKEPFDLDQYEMRAYLKTRMCVRGCDQKCKYKDTCQYYQFLEDTKSQIIDIQITNHNQYLMDLKTRFYKDLGILRKSDFVIIDEAHKFREAAMDIFGAQLAEKEISDYLNSIEKNCRKGLEKEYRSLLEAIRTAEFTLMSELKAKIADIDEDEARNNKIMLSPKEKHLIMTLKEKIHQLERYQKTHSNSALMLTEKLNAFVGKKNALIWIGTDDGGSISLNYAPENIDMILYKIVWNRGIHHVLTSGTMSDGESFDFFEKRNGLNKLSMSKKLRHCSPSPFDYENHTRLYIPTDIPFPENDSEEYVCAVSKRIVELIKATNGHTAVLFTSYKLLHAVSKIVRPQIEEYEVFSMTKSSRSEIARFKASKNGVLFASGSMWEGVDCVGDGLSSVIIVRLPFPIRSAITEETKNNYKDVSTFVKEYAVPEMVIKLRQGIGRLIRSESDTGLISILDSRALHSAYSGKIMNVLSKYPRVENLEEISDYFRTVKSNSYFAN